jgi:hypothetical protein
MDQWRELPCGWSRLTNSRPTLREEVSEKSSTYTARRDRQWPAEENCLTVGADDGFEGKIGYEVELEFAGASR